MFPKNSLIAWKNDLHLHEKMKYFIENYEFIPLAVFKEHNMANFFENQLNKDMPGASNTPKD